MAFNSRNKHANGRLSKIWVPEGLQVYHEFGGPAKRGIITTNAFNNGKLHMLNSISLLSL